MTARKPKHLHKKPGPVHGYKPEFCEMAVEYARDGLSIVEIACKFDVSRPTIYRWKDEIPEFGHAFAKAVTYSQAWWEKQIRTGNVGNGAGQVNPVGWRHTMDNRFREDYGNRLDLTNSDGNFTPPKTIYVVGEPVEHDSDDD